MNLRHSLFLGAGLLLFSAALAGRAAQEPLGEMRLEGVPAGARVYVDGEPAAPTAEGVLRLPPGWREVQVERDLRGEVQIHRRWVEVRQGEAAVVIVRFALVRAYGRVVSVPGPVGPAGPSGPAGPPAPPVPADPDTGLLARLIWDDLRQRWIGHPDPEGQVRHAQEHRFYWYSVFPEPERGPAGPPGPQGRMGRASYGEQIRFQDEEGTPLIPEVSRRLSLADLEATLQATRDQRGSAFWPPTDLERSRVVIYTPALREGLERRSRELAALPLDEQPLTPGPAGPAGPYRGGFPLPPTPVVISAEEVARVVTALEADPAFQQWRQQLRNELADQLGLAREAERRAGGGVP